MNSKGFFFSFMAVVLVTSVFLLTAGSASAVLSEDFDVRVSDISFGSSVSLIDSLEDSVFEDSLSVASYHALNELSCYIDENGFFDSKSEFDSLLSSLVWRGSFNPVNESLLIIPGAINSAQALFDVRDDLDGDYFLVGDIDLDGFDNDDNSDNGNWSPIGNSSDPFTGIFDGNGFSITGLNVSSSSQYVGLFGNVNGASISNVSVAGSVVSTLHRVGGLIGNADNSNISYTSFSGNVSGSSFVGGLVGRSGEGLNVSFSSSSGMVNGTGGFDGNNVGGLVGLVDREGVVSFSSSSSSANSSHGSGIGGLIGSLQRNSEVYDSFASGSVSGSTHIGGLVGHISQGSSVSDSFSFGSAVGSGGDVGGLIGSVFESSNCAVNSYWDTQVSGQRSSACGVGKTTSELQMETSASGIYSSWDATIWDFGSSTEYPSLIFHLGVISSAQALFDIRDDLDGDYFLVGDIDLNGFDNDDNADNGNWSPIGNSSDPFTGSFNGKGFSITGLNVSSSSQYVGLFGNVNGASISNVSVFGNVTSTGSRVGGLIGNADNSNVSYVSFSGNVSGNWQVGGLVGRSDNGLNISFSNSSGMVNGTNDNVGGLVGLLRIAGVASFSSSSSDVDSSSGRRVGGLIGLLAGNSNVSNSFASGSVSGSSRVGGLVGDLNTGSNIFNSFSFGSVVGSGGGFVGFRYNPGNCVNSYWNTETSGQTNGGCTGATGKTTFELQTPTGPTSDVYDNWNTTIWDFGSSTEYPSLILPSFESSSSLLVDYSASGSPFGGGSGTVDEPFIVVTGKHLNNVRTDLDAYYVLVEDIDLLSDGFSNWLPIGSSSAPFTGIFDGRGFVIHNLVISSTSSGGLFGFVNGSNISNVGVNNGKVFGVSDVGGLVGNSNSSNFSNVFFFGSVVGSGRDVGGLIGESNGSLISSSFSRGSVKGEFDVGGLVGEVSGGSFNNSYSVSSVLGNSFVGGFIGSSSSNPSVRFSYFYGNVSSGGSTGFIGHGNANCLDENSNNTFWYVNSSNLNSVCGKKISSGDNLKLPVTCGVSGGSSGDSLSSSNVNFSSWDGDVWYFGDNSSLPVLRDSGREVGYSLGRILFYFSDLVRQNSGHSLTFYLNESIVQVSQDSPWIVKTSYPVDFSLRFEDRFWRRNVSVDGELSIEGIFDPLFLGLKHSNNLPSDISIPTSGSVSNSLFVPVNRSVNASSLSSSSPEVRATILAHFVNNSEYFDPGIDAPSFLDRYFGNLDISDGSSMFCSEPNNCGVEMILNPSSSGTFDFSTIFTSSSFPSSSVSRSYVGWCFFSSGLCSSPSSAPVNVVVNNDITIKLDQEFHKGIYDPE